MALDDRHSPHHRDDHPSPHRDDLRSRHDLDDDRHRRDHYNDHHGARRDRGSGPAPGPGNGTDVGDRPDDRPGSNDRVGGGGTGGNGGGSGNGENDRRDDRDDHHADGRRYRGHDDHHGGHDDDRHNDYHPDGNHHPDRDRRPGGENQDDHRPPSGPPPSDDRDHHDDRHRDAHDDHHHHHQSPPNRQDNGNTDIPDNAPRHDGRSPPPQHEHNIQDPNSAAPPSDQQDQGDGSTLINLFVRNVAKHVQEQQLIDLFSKYGKVDSAVVVRDPHSRECRGFGFVKMTSDKDADRAIEDLREFEFEGRHISVERAKRNGPHTRTPGAYMGLDRRIRDRYAGMKRSREYAYTYMGGPYAPPPPSHYPPYRPPRYHDGPRPRHDYRSMHPPPPPPEYSRPPMNTRYYDQRPPSDERDRQRRRYDLDGGQRYSPRGDAPRDQRVDGRDPPVPRESTDELH